MVESGLDLRTIISIARTAGPVPFAGLLGDGVDGATAAASSALSGGVGSGSGSGSGSARELGPVAKLGTEAAGGASLADARRGSWESDVSSADDVFVSGDEGGAASSGRFAPPLPTWGALSGDEPPRARVGVARDEAFCF